MTIDLKKFGSRLRDLRNKKGWTQEELGAKAGLNGVNISHFETGNRQPGLDILVRLARALGCTLDQFDPE